MDLKSLFDALYGKLVLRDVFGKVVPGMIFIYGSLIGLAGPAGAANAIAVITIPIWVVVVGISWMLGFCLQYWGERCKLLMTHPPGRQGNESRESFYQKWVVFHSVAQEYEIVHAERLNVIKETCGNGAIGIGAGLLLFAAGAVARRDVPWFQLWPSVALGLVVAISLAKMHREHVRRYGQLVENTIEFREKGKTGETVDRAST